MVTISTLEAEPGFAGGTHAVLGHRLHSLDHYVAVRAGAEPQVWMAPMISQKIMIYNMERQQLKGLLTGPLKMCYCTLGLQQCARFQERHAS